MKYLLFTLLITIISAQLPLKQDSQLFPSINCLLSKDKSQTVQMLKNEIQVVGIATQTTLQFLLHKSPSTNLGYDYQCYITDLKNWYFSIQQVKEDGIYNTEIQLTQPNYFRLKIWEQHWNPYKNECASVNRASMPDVYNPYAHDSSTVFNYDTSYNINEEICAYTVNFQWIHDSYALKIKVSHLNFTLPLATQTTNSSGSSIKNTQTTNNSENKNSTNNTSIQETYALKNSTNNTSIQETYALCPASNAWYSYNLNRCVDCLIPFCIKCISENTCLKCQEGYSIAQTVSQNESWSNTNQGSQIISNGSITYQKSLILYECVGTSRSRTSFLPLKVLFIFITVSGSVLL